VVGTLSVALELVVAVVLAVPVVLDDALATVADTGVLVEEFVEALEPYPPLHALNVTQARNASAVSRRVGRFINQPLHPDSFDGGCFRGKALRAQSVAGTRPAEFVLW